MIKKWRNHMNINQISNALCASAMAFTICVSQATAGDEVVIDLMGGYLFDMDHLPDPNTPFPQFFYTVNLDEQVTLTNGMMIDPRTLLGDDLCVTLIVEGELNFGQQFPTDTNFMSCFGDWIFNINGTLNIRNEDPIVFRNQSCYSVQINIPTQGALVVQTGANVTLAACELEGSINVESGASLQLPFEESLYCNAIGSITVEDNAYFDGSISDGQILIGDGSTIVLYGTINTHFSMPSGPSQINLKNYGDAGALNNCVIEFLCLPPNPKLVPTFNLSSLSGGRGEPFFNCDFVLNSIKNTQIGDSSKLLHLEDYLQWDSKIWQFNTLYAPPPTLEYQYQLRWGNSGLYVLTAPAQWCEADLNFDGVLNFFDVSAFISHFTQESVWANMNGDLRFDFFDISAFINAFTEGCP
jgi:hypothetical protein